MVRPRGSPVPRKRSPMAFNVASGQPSPDEELTETVAPSGMTAAASSSEIRLDRLIPISIVISIAVHSHRATCMRRFAHRQGHRERFDSVYAAGRRLPFTTDRRVEATHRSLIEILVLYGNFLLAVAATDGDDPGRTLRHYIPTIERTLGPMHLEAGVGVRCREGVVELSDSAPTKAHHAHDRIFQPGLPHPLACSHGGHLHDLITEHKPEGIRVMHSNVQNHASTSIRTVDSPTLQVGWQIDSMKQIGRKRASDGPALNHLAHPAVGCRVSEMVIGTHGDPCGGRCRNHCAGAVERQCQGFFTKHVLSG